MTSGRCRPPRSRGIVCEVSHPAYHHGWWLPERPLTPIGAQMNIGYALAVAVLDGAAMVRQFTPSRIDADDVWEMLARIEVKHDPAFDRPGVAHGRCRLTVHYTDGGNVVVERESSRAVAAPQSERRGRREVSFADRRIDHGRAAGGHRTDGHASSSDSMTCAN